MATLDEYRKECSWSLSELSRQAGIDFNTVQRAMEGKKISAQTARKLADALSRGLGQTLRVADIEGLNVNL
jgi:transcriptional regulator with XRE-family HTH domain